MKKDKFLTQEELRILKNISTPTICNVIETFDLRPKTEGFIKENIHPFFPELGIMVGYAATARLTATCPPTPEQDNLRFELLNLLLTIPEPRIVVIEDIDSPDCLGAFWGEVQANIHRRFGCIATVTNGGVRDLDEVRDIGFHFFAKRAIPSHAYVHLIDVGKPVTIGGLIIKNGDILHGDMHGVVKVPLDIARKILAATKIVEAREKKIVSYCQSGDFTIKGLRSLLNK